MVGTMSPARNRPNIRSLPRQRSRAKAYAAMAENRIWQTVIRVETTTEFSR